MYTITSKHDSDEQQWDAYVGSRTSTVTDLFAWRRVVAETYGLKPHFLAVSHRQQLVGALGLYEVNHPFFGHYLATAPFANDGGLYFANQETLALLLAEAKLLADELDVSYLLIRTRDADLDGFYSDRHYVGSVIDLGPGADILWKKHLPGKTRNQVRRGTKEGFSVRYGNDQMSPFFDVFHAHMRDLGSPAHRLLFYRLICQHLQEHAEFVVVYDGTVPVAGALVFRINGIAANHHTVALRHYNRRCPNYLLYWSMLERACSLGCKHFDMGRSVEGSTQLSFKKNWKPRHYPLSYNYYLRKLKDPPFADPHNPRYRLPIALWKRLPLAVTRRLGPRLIWGLV